MTALTTPMFGEMSKMVRKISAEVVALNTTGITMTALNAVLQRIRSASTAMIRPITVTMNGNTITQIALLRNVVQDRGRGEDRLVVAQPHEPGRGLVEHAVSHRGDERIYDHHQQPDRCRREKRKRGEPPVLRHA